jgi:hypothetical protein
MAQMPDARLLLSGIGEPYDPGAGTGVVGRNFAYQVGGANVADDVPRKAPRPVLLVQATMENKL